MFKRLLSYIIVLVCIAYYGMTAATGHIVSHKYNVDVMIEEIINHETPNQNHSK